MLFLIIANGSDMIMENKENAVDKVKETLAKELESLSDEGLHEFFKFFYKLNHEHANMITSDKFDEFLEAFDSNPFKLNTDKNFRKQLIDNIIKYAFDHMSLITAAMLIKRKFTMDEIIRNYYANINIFESGWF
jgi:intein/homing endonuclease